MLALWVCLWSVCLSVGPGAGSLTLLVEPIFLFFCRCVAMTVTSRVGLDQRSCATSDPVSTRMGDRLWTGKPYRYVTSQLCRLSLLPSVGR